MFRKRNLISRTSVEILPSAIQDFTFETLRLDAHGQIMAKMPGQARRVVQSLGQGVELSLVEVPGGMFRMGSIHEGGYDDERPVHPVYIRPGLWLGQYAVTQAQWLAVMGHLPVCRFKGPQAPVESISWEEAAGFCRTLSKKTGRLYRLPSEAEWECACRAGTNSPFAYGETLTTAVANYVGEHLYRQEAPGVYRHGPSPVGSFPPNVWGFYEMHGNIWEYCADVWQADYQGLTTDSTSRQVGRPAGDKTLRWRVARGGSWHEPPSHCRSAVRLQVSENDPLEFYGLRVLLQPAQNSVD